MQIEVDLEKMVSKSIIDGILNSDNVQGEVDKILESDEYQEILTKNVKNRLDVILSSEDGKKQIDDSIVCEIAKSNYVEDEVEKILCSDKYQKILQEHVKAALQEVISSEEGKEQILEKVKEYLDDYKIDYDDDFDSEMSQGIADILMIVMKAAFERFKESELK